MPRILAIAGSLRKHAYSKRILAIAASGAREAGAEVTIVDLREYPMSIYDNDVQDAAFDENAAKLQEVMAAHDGFLFASPEYNGSIPGGFKNAIDWTSRASEKFPMYGVSKGKTAAIMTASPGQFGGLRCLAHLRGVLTIMGIHVLPMEIAVPFVSAKFAGDSAEMTDEKTKSLLEKLGGALAESLAQNSNG